MTRWVAPTAGGPVRGRVTIPGSKSATARAFVLAALADGPSTLSGVLEARDTRLMRTALGSLGVGFTDHPDASVTVTPPARFAAGAVEPAEVAARALAAREAQASASDSALEKSSVDTSGGSPDESSNASDEAHGSDVDPELPGSADQSLFASDD